MGQSMMLMTRVLRATTEASIGGASSGGTTKAKEAKKKANKSKAAPLGACVRPSGRRAGRTADQCLIYRKRRKA